MVDALSNGFGAFALSIGGERIRRHRLYPDLEVDAIHQGATELVPIAIHLGGSAHTGSRRMAKKSTRAWICGGDQ